MQKVLFLLMIIAIIAAFVTPATAGTIPQQLQITNTTTVAMPAWMVQASTGSPPSLSLVSAEITFADNSSVVLTTAQKLTLSTPISNQFVNANYYTNQSAMTSMTMDTQKRMTNEAETRAGQLASSFTSFAIGALT